MAPADGSDSDSVLLDANSSQILKKLLACSSCNAYHGRSVYFCHEGHNVCFLCYKGEDVECPVNECAAELMSERCIRRDLSDMVHAMKLPVLCKNRNNGCTYQNIIEKVNEHESECEHRLITGWLDTDRYLFKDFAAKVDNDYIKEQKWHFKNKFGPRYGGVFKFFIGPDQRQFCMDIGKITEKDAPLCLYVVGGKEVAKKYQAEVRIFSNEENISLTYNGPVFPVDNAALSDAKAFQMKPEWFKTFNQGHKYFGNHNKDKNEEIVIPVLYKIIKKELDIPTDLANEEEMYEDEK